MYYKKSGVSKESPLFKEGGNCKAIIIFVSSEAQ